MKRTRAVVWEQRVAAWRASGQTAEAFSKGKDYGARNIIWWSSELRRRAKKDAKHLPSAPRMARVIRTPSPTVTKSDFFVRVGLVEIPLAAGFDKTLLAEVVAALSGGRQ